jgi:hypothetical protein
LLKFLTESTDQEVMKSRPWPLVILALLQFLAPVFSIVVSAHLSHLSVLQYTRSMWGVPWLQRLDFFFLMPIAGLAIYRPRRWSYPVFIGITAWVAFENFHEWRLHTQMIPLWLVLVLFAMDVALVSYFLLPAVRTVYFDRTLRWWETSPRYRIDIDCTLTDANGTVAGKIENLSSGGLFFKTTPALSGGDVREFRFDTFGRTVTVSGKVVHVREGDDVGYGVRFEHTPESRKALNELTRVLDQEALPRWPAKVSYSTRLTEFKRWGIRLLTTGKGLLPEVRK